MIASKEQDQKELSQIGKHTYKEKEINVTAADFKAFMTKVFDAMNEAGKYAQGDHQKKMVEHYAKHF